MILQILNYSKVLGNKKVDVVVKDVMQKKGRKTNHWSSFTYIKIELQKTKAIQLLRWSQTKSQKSEAIMQRFYIPNKKSGMSLTLSKTLEKYTTQYYQI